MDSLTTSVKYASCVANEQRCTSVTWLGIAPSPARACLLGAWRYPDWRKARSTEMLHRMTASAPLQCRELDAGDDMEALTSLIRAAYAPHAENGLRYWATHQTVADTIKRCSSGTGLVGSIDGRVVATILLRKPDPESKVEAFRDPATWKFEQFAVDPGMKGKGIGRQLHDFALAHAYAHGCRRMALDTAAPAEALIATYTSWGYTVIGTCDWRPFTNYPSVVMAKNLTTRPGHGRAVAELGS